MNFLSENGISWEESVCVRACMHMRVFVGGQGLVLGVLFNHTSVAFEDKAFH